MHRVLQPFEKYIKAKYIEKKWTQKRRYSGGLLLKKDKSEKELQKIMDDDSYIVGYCSHHDYPVNQGIFEYKGCWTCYQYFSWKNWLYISVEEAAKHYGVCKSTIYRWIKRGRLKARLFTMGRTNLNVPKKFYAILPNQLRPNLKKQR